MRQNLNLTNHALSPHEAEPKKKNYFLIVLLVAALGFLYYNIFTKEKTSSTSTSEIAISENPHYTIEEITRNDRFAFNATVRIDNKIADNLLINIAKQVITDLKPKSEKGVVFFLLPEMKVLNNGAWAVVDFPEARNRMIGQSIPEEQIIKDGAKTIVDYVGLWMDNGIQGDIIIRIRIDKIQGYVWEYISPKDPKPSELASPLKRMLKNGQTIYIDLESKNTAMEYYVVDPNGDLSAYDKDGYIATFTKLK